MCSPENYIVFHSTIGFWVGEKKEPENPGLWNLLHVGESDTTIVASASNFKRFSRSLEQFFLKVGQNNFGNLIPVLW